MKTLEPGSSPEPENSSNNDHFRFHRPHLHLAPTFGSDWFGLKAESFARFFGTPFFLITQTVVVALWVGANVLSLTGFDPYPFILLNLAFSLQAAYAAPLILLAQTRQAERDHLHAQADAQHREALAQASDQRQAIAAQNTAQLLELLQQNTQLTELVRQLTEHIDVLTVEIHQSLLDKSGRQP